MYELMSQVRTTAMNFGASVRATLVAIVGSERGVTMMEYALIAALVAIAAVTILSTLGHTISTTFSKINANMS
jgi:pilus assembly protein Flp/PilA